MPLQGDSFVLVGRGCGRRVEDAVWSYLDPLPKAWKARCFLCFLGDGIETEVDDDK